MAARPRRLPQARKRPNCFALSFSQSPERSRGVSKGRVFRSQRTRACPIRVCKARAFPAGQRLDAHSEKSQNEKIHWVFLIVDAVQVHCLNRNSQKSPTGGATVSTV